jgi:integrase
MSIYPDKKDGALTGRFRVEVQLNGQRLRGRFNTLAEAQDVEREWTEKLARGDTTGAKQRDDLRGIPHTLSQLLHKGAPLLWPDAERRLDSERKIEAIISWQGDLPLKKITSTTIDDLIGILRAAGKAPGTVNRYLSALHKLLKWGSARGREYVPFLPEFNWEDEDEGRIRWLSSREEAALIAALQHLGQDEMADYVAVAIDTGCRLTELVEAKRDQLDGRWLRLWDTKNGTPRSVPLTDRALNLLARRLPWSFTGPVLRYWFKKAKALIGITDEEFVIHSLRHTCATRLVERNVNLRVVQKFMGHKDIKTTLRYAHVSDELLALAATKLSSLEILQARPMVGALEGGSGGPQEPVL